MGFHRREKAGAGIRKEAGFRSAMSHVHGVLTCMPGAELCIPSVGPGSLLSGIVSLDG